jgi:hypothetical protein
MTDFTKKIYINVDQDDTDGGNTSKEGLERE